MTTPPPYGAYPPPPPGAYAGYYGYPQAQPTNALAIVSLVCAFLFAPLGIIFGHMSLSQIKKTGEEGRGLAIAGLVISYMITVLTIVVVALSVLFIVQVGRDLERLDGLTPDYPGITATPSPPVDNTLPPFDPPKTLGSNCQYPPTTEPASKSVKPPQNGRTATDPSPHPRDHHHQSGPRRAGVGQRQDTVHGQQLHEPGQAGVLRQHHMPPVDHLDRTWRAAVW
jgi:peptidyl-prolyl cis-trans isomerase B (cyclophilin B)